LENDLKAAVALLKKGQPPGNKDVINKITVGIQPFIRFLQEKYLIEYIAQGGSKIKFVTGKPGSGKTHFLQLLDAAAAEESFVTVSFSAKDIWIYDFKDVYGEIFIRCDLNRCLEKCAKQIIQEMGYDGSAIPTDMTFTDYLSDLGELDAITKKEIRNQLQDMFLKNPLIDNNFAIACSLLTGGMLGHPVLEGPNRELLHQWLSGSKDVKLPALRRLGFSPSRITKYNARHMLRSLAEIHRIAALPGILVMIDNVDILVESSALDTIRYTKLKREDAYECIRELIDEIDSLRNVMFVYAFDKKLTDDELNGLKSYQALWMRIQNEIVSNKFNKFTDMIDLDALSDEIYGADTLTEMSSRIAEVVNMVKQDAYPINGQSAAEMLANARFTGTALPRRVGQATMNREFSNAGYEEEV
jgi:hypothetical protein